MVDQPEFQSSGQSLFPGWGEFDLLFNVDILNPLLKNNGRDRRLSVGIFVVWGALIVGEFVVVTWARRSYLGPSEISSLCSWYDLKLGQALRNLVCGDW